MKSSIAATMSLSSTLASAAYTCTNFTVPMTLNTTIAPPKYGPFADQMEAEQFLNNITTAECTNPFGDPTNITIEVDVAVQYCVPSPQPESTAGVQVLTHGIGFDHTYWDFGGPGSEYNYIEYATSLNYCTLSYDRLGTGNSTKPDPYSILQAGPEVTVLIELTALLRNGGLSSHANTNIAVPTKPVVHIGHSFGSALTLALANSSPHITSGVVLTGFAPNHGFGSNDSFAAQYAISSGFHIASQNQPERFGGLDSGYLTWGDKASNQYGFLHYPNFSPEVLEYAEETKWTFSASEMLMPVKASSATYAGPVMIISGQFDRIFCGGDCCAVLPDARNLIPNANPFVTYIQPDTGHGLNLHYNATGTYKVVNDFISEQIQNDKL